MSDSNILGKRNFFLSSLTSVLSISVVLLILGFTVMLILNAKKISDSAKKNIGFTLFLDDKSGTNDTQKLLDVLKTSPYTDSVIFVGKEKAADDMKKELGNDFVDFLGNNPLPNSFEVKVKSDYSSSDSIENIRTNLSRFSIIKEFFWEQSLVKAINLNIRKLEIIGLSFLFFLSLITFILINGTIKLSIIQKGVLNLPPLNSEYNIAKERKNLQIASLITGILSSAIASLFLISILFAVHPDSDGLFSLDGIWLIAVIIFIFGTGISGISGHFAVKKYLIN